ncbi:MAG: LptF/LptG family permease [Muribaculaceae bacterium]|nr:LptF/LptG family permease [Muribaculaceae bacterium]
MRLIKRLDLFILKSFLPLFAMTFFIVLFIVLMQFLWKFIDDLVGKGLSMGVLAELFFYAAVSMVPMALPLAILLASLMTYGNFGEKFELTAMKASGISLFRSMLPVMWTVGAIAVGAFFFQNDVLPHAQVKMWTLLFSVRQKSPELEIPEGVFYDQIPGYNLYVKTKNRDTGMLYDVMIYDVSRPGDNSTILLADSTRLTFTPDMRYLYLHLFQGEQFENLREQNQRDRNVPFRRETFVEKEVLIPFDANFNRLDEGGMRKQYVGKNIAQLRHTIDSVGQRVDSMGRTYADELLTSSGRYLPGSRNNGMNRAEPIGSQRARSLSAGSRPGSSATSPSASSLSQTVSTESDKPAEPDVPAVDLDTVLMKLSASQRSQVFEQAQRSIERQSSELQFKAMTVADEKKTIRRHAIELIKKFTLSVACLIFFFIGAPLGAIIRKGGLGTPLVISVLLFLVYYIIDNTGYKMARDGHWAVWAGMWLSTSILAPLGIYLTYKAMNDSAVFDKDRYMAVIRKILGRRPDRSVRYKEVIINDISLSAAHQMLAQLSESAKKLEAVCSVPVSYMNIWTHGLDRTQVEAVAEEIDSTVDYLTDCRNAMAVNKLVNFPVVLWRWMLNPTFGHVWIGKTLRILFPLGFPVYLADRMARRRLKSEMERVVQTCEEINNLLERYGNRSAGSDERQ